MRSFKMFGLAVLTALVAMAFVGANAAMAESTSLCKADTAGLAVEKNACEPISHVHETTLSGAKAKLLSSSLNVECDVLFLGEVVTEGSPLVISGNFTYSNCNSGCTATEEGGPSEISVLKEGHEKASVTGEGLVHLNCSGFINCRYIGEGLAGAGKGPLLSSETNGEVSISEQETKKESGILCPSTAKLDITTTPLVKTYLGGELLAYCVEYEHKTGGSFQDSECKTAGAGAYELVWGEPGLKVGQVGCVVDHDGLWQEVAEVICAKDYVSLTGGGQEKATITKVE